MPVHQGKYETHQQKVQRLNAELDEATREYPRDSVKMRNLEVMIREAIEDEEADLQADEDERRHA